MEELVSSDRSQAIIQLLTRVRVTRVIMETSPREEGDNGHNNQLGTKAAATARTVVATTARGITMAARATA